MEGPPKRLHICLGLACNNNCLFCMEDDREARARRLSSITTEAARQIMAQASDRTEIMFTAGEPTLREDLPELLQDAKRLGFKQIGMISNGRRLSYRPYLDGLVRRGLNYVLVSVHGSVPRLHDGLTRTPGSFRQTVAGMHNIATLRAEGVKLRFATSTVLNRRNLPDLAGQIRFLTTYSPDEMVFNAIQPLGRGEQHFNRLVPRYSEMVSALHEAFSELQAIPDNLRVLDIPLCMTGSLPESVLGKIERHRHFEPEADIPLGADRVESDENAVLQSGEVRLRLVTKEGLDDVMRLKEPGCSECREFDKCDGVWRRYVQEYGFDEFRPVLEEVPS